LNPAKLRPLSASDPNIVAIAADHQVTGRRSFRCSIWTMSAPWRTSLPAHLALNESGRMTGKKLLDDCFLHDKDRLRHPRPWRS
jgi:hypothetical protein